MVILEYATHGSLLSFLKTRKQLLKTTWKKETIGMEDELTTCDLAVIAYQVAKGMEFLASRKVCILCPDHTASFLCIKLISYIR